MARTETHTATSVLDASVTRAGVIGLVGGMVAAMVMAAYAMTAAATYQDTGFFTPLYHIGSAFGSGEAAAAMKTSMEGAGTGDLYHFAATPAALGVGIHLIAGAGWGIVFALGVRALRIARASVVPLGTVFGLAVMLVMAYAVLPAVAEAFNSGAPIRDMATMVGWGTFAVEHVIFGLGVGVAALALAPAGLRARTQAPSRQRATGRQVHAS